MPVDAHKLFMHISHIPLRFITLSSTLKAQNLLMVVSFLFFLFPPFTHARALAHVHTRRADSESPGGVARLGIPAAAREPPLG